MTRFTTPERRNELKTAFKLLVQAVGGQEAAIACTRVQRTQISDYGNIDMPDKLAPVDVVLDLEAISGRLHVTAALARCQGYELLPIDQRPSHELAACLALLATDNGKVFADAAQAMAGCGISDRDREKLLRDLDEVILAARETRAALLYGR